MGKNRLAIFGVAVGLVAGGAAGALLGIPAIANATSTPSSASTSTTSTPANGSTGRCGPRRGEGNVLAATRSRRW